MVRDRPASSTRAPRIAFVADDFDTVRNIYRRLRENNVRVRVTDHGFTKSIYFEDPDGIGLEIYAEVPEFDWHKKGLGMREPFDIENAPVDRQPHKTAGIA
jgi:catechol-2,3-dioxygenase